MDSDYEVFSETIFLQNMVYQPTEERDSFAQLTKDEDDSFNPETSVILLNEPSDNNKKTRPYTQMSLTTTLPMTIQKTRSFTKKKSQKSKTH